SLTVNEVDGCVFGVNIVPHTRQETTIKGFQAGSKVNLEVDLLARYLERMMTAPQAEHQTDTSSNITPEFLSENGFK
ncbi:MAG: riboflavin synthase, partial [Gammaproteobacteria bacterium]|nr:riboflavin synthase [Gammaproteobacteria bacterium]